MNKGLYWLIQLTWGIVTTLIGFLITLVLKCFGCKSYKNGYGLITTIGGNWGGLSFGPFAFCGRYNELDDPCFNLAWYHHTRAHEFGHSIQVLFMGPFHILLVGIPSALRYWYRRLTPNKPHSDYDAIWFEGTATKWGTRWISEIEKDWD